MQIFKKKNALINCLSLLKQENKQIGFVPTMGALHQGHISLLEESKKNNHISVVTIFVNPTQFNKEEDLKKYPKTIEKDLEMLKNSNCDIVFMPSVDEIYADNVTSKVYSFDGIEHQMEGEFRPGHFDGVATIVQAFFEIVTPTNSYFGEKDFQQLQVVKKMVEKEQLPVNVVGCAIFREKDGLAMSSRNARLTTQQRAEAPFIFETLTKTNQLMNTIAVDEIDVFVKEEFSNSKLLELEYFTIAEEESLERVTLFEPNKKYRAFIAVNAGNVRLIDNISLSVNN